MRHCDFRFKCGGRATDSNERKLASLPPRGAREGTETVTWYRRSPYVTTPTSTTSKTCQISFSGTKKPKQSTPISPVLRQKVCVREREEVQKAMPSVFTERDFSHAISSNSTSMKSRYSQARPVRVPATADRGH